MGTRSPFISSPVLPKELEQVLNRFSQSWREGIIPDLDDYLPQQLEVRQVLLPKLAQTDLEFALRAGHPITVESYLEHFPELLRDRVVVLDLIATETRVRRSLGDKVACEEFLLRFPHWAQEVQFLWRSELDPDTVVILPTPPLIQPSESSMNGQHEDSALRSGAVATVHRAWLRFCRGVGPLLFGRVNHGSPTRPSK